MNERYVVIHNGRLRRRNLDRAEAFEVAAEFAREAPLLSVEVVPEREAPLPPPARAPYRARRKPQG